MLGGLARGQRGARMKTAFLSLSMAMTIAERCKEVWCRSEVCQYAV